jgi:hypothetical protein
MGLKAKHPAWEAQDENWQQMSDCYAGEAVIKGEGEKYLPPTAGMRYDGMGAGGDGLAAYLAYKERAVFPDDVRDAVDGLVGLMHRKPPTIQVPDAMAPLLERLTADGADAETLLRRINAAQLLHGRLGLLVDVPDDAGTEAMPYVALYSAHACINWMTRTSETGNDELALVVLNETGAVMKPNLEWEEQEAYRVLMLDVFLAEIEGAEPSNKEPKYMVATKDGDGDLKGLEWIEPSLKGGTLKAIPFVFVNAMDLAPDPDRPPLLGLSDTCLSIYRGEADYRQSLYMQGQETLVIIGAPAQAPNSEDDRRVGAGAVLDLEVGGDAKYVGVSAAGLAEQAKALAADYQKASQQGLKLLDMADGSSQQSGDALRIRVAARTASITGIARAGAMALQQVLRHCALFMGANPEEVIVTPNLDFVDDRMTGKELGEWAAAKNAGAPISWETIHEIMQSREVTQKTYEEEQALIEAEEPVGGVDPLTGEPLGTGDPAADPNAPPEGDPPPEEDPNAPPQED